MARSDIKELSYDELVKAVTSIPSSAYRAGQIYRWIYKKNKLSFGEMTDLGAELIEKLESRFYIGALVCEKHERSKDGTQKFLFKLIDGEFVETVLIPAKGRNTLCVSTQAGCKYKCAFCASGRRGFKRQLSVSEIISQLTQAETIAGVKVTNYVFMGMGEPLDNFDNLKKAILVMNDKRGMDIGARRITISTSGIIPGIRRLRELDMQLNLSVSLHAVSDALRTRLMPVNKIYPLGELLKALEEFLNLGGRTITFEYILIKGLNMSGADSDQLASIARKLRAKINLIPYSQVPGSAFEMPSDIEVDEFALRLASRGINVTVRESKGKDINAACGQLAGGF